MTVTFTIPVLPILIYLAIGVVFKVPLEYWAWRILDRQGLMPSFWTTLRRALRRNPWYVVVLSILLWPAAVWEVWRAWRKA